jgi:hypothetical protein
MGTGDFNSNFKLTQEFVQARGFFTEHLTLPCGSIALAYIRRSVFSSKLSELSDCAGS